MTGVTRYPTGLQYTHALFSTSLAFRDPVLRGGKPVLNAMNIPRAISGNFASVFTIQGTDGRNWAVKCFTRYVADQATRYQQVSKALQNVDSSWKVEFQYLSDGVLCEGIRYPALKMEWVEATGLLSYIEANLSDRGKLAELAQKFADLVLDLTHYGIAHGDLQHGNILVTPSGELKLIDYDGMFVPGLDDLGASEVGHDNYQSPLRTKTNWGPDIDRFSSWVIFTSLSVLAIDPGLWSELHAEGDEALLFHKDDFTDRDGSRARYALATSGLPKLREIARDIDFLWALDLSAVPALDGFLDGAAPEAARAAPRSGSATAAVSADWLWQNRPLPEASNGTRATSQVGPPIGTAAWLTDHLPATPNIDFTRPKTGTRLTFAVLVSLMMLFAVLAVAAPGLTAFDLVLLPIAWAVALVSYKRTPERREKGRSHATWRERQHSVAKANQTVANLENSMRKLDRDAESNNAKVTRKAEKARADEQREIAAVDRRRENEIKRIDREITTLQNRSRSEAEAALRALQRTHIDICLQEARISSAKISGIGPALVSTLAGYGIRTAADFTGIRYTQKSYGTHSANIVLRSGMQVSPRGIGEKKAQALDIWRRSVEGRAHATQPMALPQVQSNAILDKYAQQILSLRNEQQAARTHATTEQDDLRKKWFRAHTEILKELNDINAHFARLRAEKNPEIAAAHERSTKAHWQRDFAKRELNRYRRIRYTRYLRRLVTG